MADIEQRLSLYEESIDTFYEEMQRNLTVFEKIKENYRMVQQIREQIQEQIKQDIEALTSEYKENNKDDSSDIGVVNQQEQQLLQDLKEAKRQQDGLSSLCQEGQQNLGVLREEKDRLEAEKERLENETTVIIPKRREEISLYTTISCIRFDFDGSEHEVKGYICNKKDVKPFCFDKTKCSQFFITNSLWDLMSED